MTTGLGTSLRNATRLYAALCTKDMQEHDGAVDRGRGKIKITLGHRNHTKDTTGGAGALVDRAVQDRCVSNLGSGDLSTLKLVANIGLPVAIEESMSELDVAFIGVIQIVKGNGAVSGCAGRLDATLSVLENV